MKLIKASQYMSTAVLATAVFFSNTASAAFSQIVAIGDSLSDHGNIFAVTAGANPPPPYFNGRFSNGPTWLDNLAADLGVTSPTASITGGTNLAFGGARTSNAGGLGQPSAQTQTAQAIGAGIDPNALYTILIGGNDLNALGVGYGLPELQADAALVASLAGDLVAAGAQNVLVVNVPDLGSAPIADGNEAATTAATQLFNGTLAANLGGGSPNIAFLDAFAVSQDLVANPGTYGLTNVDDPCLDAGAGTLCANPNDYLFWDLLHPTARGHELISDAALLAVQSLPSAAPIPVPAALPLMLSALVGLWGARRARV